jgi:uncharacterized phage protein (TIGR02218 family)
MKLELFRFVEGSTVYLKTNYDQPYTYDSGSGAEVYTPTTVKRTEIESKNEINKSGVNLTFPITDIMARHWMIDNVETVVTLTIFEVEDTDVAVSWKGRLSSVKPGQSDITIAFESIFTSLRRPGLRARFLRSCRHSHYRRGCNLDKAGFAIPGICSAITTDGTQITVSAAAGFANDYFTAGMIAAPDGTLRFVTGHAGSTLTLMRRLPALDTAFATGPCSVTLYPGCDRTRVTCNTKFNNLPNYGGFDWIPTRNPFDGNSIL